MSLKDTADNLKKTKGNVRGDIVLGSFAYIKEKEGEEGIKKVKERLIELNYDNSLDRLSPMEWYPEHLSVMVILAAKEIFNWQKEDIFEMGKTANKQSFITKTVIKYFVSVERAFKEASRYWDKYFDFGALEPIEMDKKKKIIKIAIKGHKFHPDICHYQAGFISKIAQLALGKRVDVTETECPFKGGSDHEYLISWR